MRLLIATLCVVLFSCNASKKSNHSEEMKASFEPSFTPGPPTIVYKTKADYNNLVPVILNKNKDSVVAFPHPNDLKIGGELRVPKQLSNDWLLDEKGINENVAFISLTYQEYALLDKPPSLDSLFEMLIDSNPILKMCNCGNRNSFDNIEGQLNTLIKEDILKIKCKEIKK